MASSTKNSPDKSWLNLKFHDEDKQRITKPDELQIDKKDYPPSINNDALLDRIQGSMFGMAIGDALGAHVEFRPRSYLEANPVKDLGSGGTWGLEKGQFTDDTSMALCLANSLIVCQDFIPYDQLIRYKWWYRNGYMSSTGHCFDIGAATRQSIQEFEGRQRKFAQEYGFSLDEMDFSSNPDLFQQFDVYCSKDGVAGNGALMRLAPVPLFFYRDPVKAVEYSGISGKITHGDKKAYDACRYYGALIVDTLNGKKKNDLLSDTFYNDHKHWFGTEPLHSDIMSITQGSYKKKGGYNEGIRGKGYIVSALEAALWAFWSDDGSFETGALNAVNLGDDTDTTAAIYGQLAGAYYGYNKLPNQWRDLIYAKNFVSCVSNWIAYEGEMWFKRQTRSDVSAPLTNSDPTAETGNIGMDFNRWSNVSHNSQVSITGSMGRNTMPVIERKAIDPSGQIGSFYNVYRDRIIQLSQINFSSKNSQAPPLIKCITERGNKIERQNLLRFIGFDDELRLSLVSNIVSPTGIASVIEYPYLIDECTRVLYYSHNIRSEYSPINLDNIRKHIEQSTSKGDATHIITGIDIGIDLIVILRLTSDDSKIIDDTLSIINQCLNNDTKLSSKVSLDGIVSTHIYSNIDYLTKQKTLIDVYHAIFKMKNNIINYQPSNYILDPIEKFISNNNKNGFTFIPVKLPIVQKIEQYLFQFSWINKMWSTTLHDDKDKTLSNYLEEQLREVQKQLFKLNEEYENERKRFEQLILNIRYKKYSQNILEQQILNEDIETTLKDNIDEFIYSLTSLKEKASFINDLKKRRFDYHNANKYNIQQNDNENNIQQKLITNNHHLRFLCSNDTLNKNNLSTLEQLCLTLCNEAKSNSHLRLIYVDFTYSSHELDQIKIFPLNNYTKNTTENTSSLLIKKEISFHPSSIDDKTINILLLGKSGVGKSTLINNFINCRKFNRYEDIQLNKSLLDVLIPFSRILFGSGGEHDGHLVYFGISDHNEDYDHPDQSTTQQCKLHHFNLDNNEKLCIIDTPGFGLHNDDIIMQQILSHIINLTHLNAICIIIQSDDIKLDDYQICLTKLFHFLGQNAVNNLLFCFTKTLSKNINNNDKRNNLIKLMLESLNISNINFNQKLIFDFDSTYFIDSTISHRFLSSNNSFNRISEQSWTISKNEWNRLLNYIRQNLYPYSIQQGLQKAKSARLEINQLIRPLLETIRNYFRNFILSKTDYPNHSIELRPTSLLYPSAICYSCKRNYYLCGQFWIISDSPHDYRSKCYTCSCNSNQHFRIDYQLECKYIFNQTNSRSIQLINWREDLLHMSVHLANFIIHGDQTTNNDPFLFYLNKMIDEERFFCEHFSSHRMNLTLYNQLIRFRQDYYRYIDALKQKPRHNQFDIDDLIQEVKQIPMVKIQLNVARKM